jgi:hypothetical protein
MIKPHKRFCFVFFALIFFLSPANLFAQKTNAYRFIEPNISIAYDSNVYKITNRYSNTVYETEAYDIELKAGSLSKTYIHIKAEHSTMGHMPRKTQDSMALLGIKDVLDMAGDSLSFVDYDKAVRDINGISCLGFVSYHKENKQYNTMITCWHATNDDQTSIEFISAGKASLDANYEMLKPLLTGFRSYSQADIAAEEKLISNKYTVVVTPSKTDTGNFQYRPKTFLGIVTTKQKTAHTIKEVRLATSYGKEIFSPEPDGTIPIMCNDKDKGTITKKGELIVLNSFGKNVKIPFTFSYINK